MAKGDFFIDGKWIKGKGMSFNSLDPATNKVVYRGKAAMNDQVDSAVTAARKRFEEWSRRSIQDRAEIITRYSSILDKKRENMARLIASETGKPLWESRQEAGAMVAKAAISIKAHRERCRTRRQKAAGMNSSIHYHPHGVVGVLGPFNLPGHLPNGHIIPALLAGNTAVFKPSELTPAVGEFMMKCWQQSGLPAGVLNLVQGAGDCGKALVSHRDIDGIFFTGSFKTGAAIHKAFGGQPQKILALEMGGNNPLVVHEVKDLEAAVQLTILSAFITSGQRCVCARRLILVDGPESEMFLKALVAASAKIKVGHYRSRPEPFMGPLVAKKAADTVMSEATKLKSKGAEVLLAPKRVKSCKNAVSPGIIDVTSLKTRSDEEIFGPLLQVVHVADFDQAIDEANATAYGLSAGLISDRRANYTEFKARIRAGIVNWNRQITGASSSAPFGGIGKSGNHRPSAYYAADYCSYPCASIEASQAQSSSALPPGLPF